MTGRKAEAEERHGPRTAGSGRGDDTVYQPGRPPSRTAGGRLYRWGRGCARRPWWVIAGWLLLLCTAVIANRLGGGTYEDDFSLPGTPVQIGADLLEAHGGAEVRGVGSQIVLKSAAGGLSAHRRAIDATGSALARIPHVLSAAGPFTTAAAHSTDGTTGYFTIRLEEFPGRYGAAYLSRFDEAVRNLRADGVTVEYGSPLGELARPKAPERLSEVIGLGAAVVVLLIGFGSIAAAGLPLLTSVTALAVGLSVLGLLAGVCTLASESPTLATMMGLGAGLDYSLVLTTRYRHLLHTTDDPCTAAGEAMASGGRAVLIAAAAVAVALAGLCVSGVGFITTLGVAAGVTVLVAALATLSLAPALFGLLGRRIDRLHLGRATDEGIAAADLWHRWARTVGDRPWRFLAAGVLVIGTLSIPLTAMRLGHVDAGASPVEHTERRAYDLVSKAFGPGTNGPLTVVVALDPNRADKTTDTRSVAASLYGALGDTPGIASVDIPVPSADGALLVATATPETGPQDPATSELLHRVDHDTLPRALSRTGARGYVTGTTAARLTFQDVLAERLPAIVTFVVCAAFLLLLSAFRGLLVAAKAALLNLLSIGAALGVVVAVFQWGWGSSLFGVTQSVPVEPYVPILMLAIVFGLSMDYEIFLIARMREVWLRTGDNHLSVATGLASTARVITCAALVMTSVFFAFLLSTEVVTRMMALGLGVSVIIDATVIRLMLVPAAMYLFREANWWFPRGR
ncbi:MMPL family transporter [Streptomyces lavendulae]|uniref:MMPL family transporter n=1 Tax=Streptomyces lavendulae TaxID=1914 RepID=UPI0038255973